MDKLDPRRTALVLIDLQKGILPFAGGPHAAADVVTRSASLAARFRALGAPVVLVRVGWSDGAPDALRQPVDQPSTPPAKLPDEWWEFPAELAQQPSDILVIKRQWSAFYGTELDLQLRRRGIDTIVLAGIATSIGVESTARIGWELGYAQVFAEDAMSAPRAEHHAHSVGVILPRIGRVQSTAAVLAALS